MEVFLASPAVKKQNEQKGLWEMSRKRVSVLVLDFRKCEDG